MDRIDELTSDCFNFLIQLRRLDPAAQPPPETLQQRFRTLIDTMQRRGNDLGFSREDVMEMTYAILSLADEVAIFLGGNLRTWWLGHQLQLTFFNEANAGENFYVRVNALRQDPRRIDAVRVYYLCLVLGFKGRYHVRGGETELQAITDTLAADLSRAGMFGSEKLSEHGDRPPGEKVASEGFSLPVVALAGVAVGLSVLFYVGLRVSLSSEVASVLARITQLVQ